jgi:hypothetical protein
MDLEDISEGWLGFTRKEVSKPTIAAGEGHCVASGFEMVLWCDLRVAGQGSTFGCFERQFGFPLVDGGAQRLPRIVTELAFSRRTQPIDFNQKYLKSTDSFNNSIMSLLG